MAMANVAVTERVPGMVSVIMPFLNPRESFLRDAVQSIESQSYRNWELILVDDGSDERIRHFALDMANSQRDRIACLHHEGHRNLGISASRNLGIASARGEYIAFLDADDIWDSAQLQEQVDLLEQYSEAEMVYGNTVYWHSWRVGADEKAGDEMYSLGVPLDQVSQPPSILRLILARQASPPCMTSIIVRRRVFDAGVSFETSFPLQYEDQVFMAKVASAYPIYVADRCWGKYRQHGGSVTAGGDDSSQALEWRLKYLRWMSSYFDETGMDDGSLRFLLWLEAGMIRNRGINLLARYYRLWRARFRRLLASLADP
jgi:glycosyltransferase involved in cell wall biosynthesis